jgi:DNA repair photolyase
VRPRAIANPPNPYLTTEVEYLEDAPGVLVTYYEDATRTILSRNDSPDLPFTFSINPYRGCQHACAYCYARPTHEYLGFGAGTDFDTQIAAKLRAPELLREAFEKPSWKGDILAFSGVTDCYQPLEASLRLTRGCLEVCAEYRNPVGVITKAPLIERDLDLLLRLQAESRVHVSVSIPLWNKDHARAIEPFVATPQRRMETVRRLSIAGIPVTVMIAPFIPGLGDEDVLRIMQAAKDAGARSCHYSILHLPGSSAPVFEERLRENLPERAERVLHRIRETHHGELNDKRFGYRFSGSGPYAMAMAALFEASAKKAGFPLEEARRMPEQASTFRRPPKAKAQLELF